MNRESKSERRKTAGALPSALELASLFRSFVLHIDGRVTGTYLHAMRILALATALLALSAAALGAQEREKFTRADTLRGSNGPQRSWWDVSFYDLHVAISPTDSSVKGSNAITYRVL